jgi:four helix bundle protein
MAHHHFEEMEIWKRSSRLAVSVLLLTNKISLYALRDQMSRSSISVPSNIAEGAERDSDKEFRRFLSIAKGSLAELRTQCYIAAKAEILTMDEVNPLIAETRELAAMIQAFRKKLGGDGFLNKIVSLFL